MSATGSGCGDHASARGAGAGVGQRLLRAFAATAAITVAAVAAGLYAFAELGTRLETIDDRVPRALVAGRVARSAERIIATAPALLAAPDRDRFEAVAATVTRELDRLEAMLPALDGDGAAGPFAAVRSRAVELGESLASLESLVARRTATTERVAGLRRTLFRTGAELERLLSPWLSITGDEARAVAARPAGAASGTTPVAALDRHRAVRDAASRVPAVTGLLAEASTASDADRLAVLGFQLRLELDGLEAAAEPLDPRLRALLADGLATLRALARGDGSIPAERATELALARRSGARLAAATALSARLAASVDRVGAAAGRDVADAVAGAVEVRDTGARALSAFVAPILLGSLILVWMHVRRRIARPVTALADAMLALAAGAPRAPLHIAGHDEVAAMGRAVETFRRHAIERDALLAERAGAAERLEREVRERTAELERANAFKTRFLAAASHDLRQPLHALNLFVAQLRDTGQGAAETDERRRLTARVDASLGNMNDLFDGLLDMSGLETGALEPELRAVRIAPSLERLEATFAGAARARRLQLRVVPSDAVVRSDPVLLERVLSNLVANAIRHTDGTGVLVGCRRRGDRLRIEVRDAGPGIPPDRHAAVFEEFRRFAPERPGRAAGLGLGLAIVDRLAALLGCRVELRSAPGRGSCFSVAVPVAPVADVRGPLPVPAPFPDPLRGRTVVVVDDDRTVLEATEGAFRRWGCAVLTAPSAEAAAAALGRYRCAPDLLVVDCALADGRTGAEAVALLRAACGRDVPAFLISGDTTPARADESRADGLVLLHKPLGSMALRAASTGLLRRAVPRGPRGPRAPPTSGSRNGPRAALRGAARTREARSPESPPRCGCPPPTRAGSP